MNLKVEQSNAVQSRFGKDYMNLKDGILLNYNLGKCIALLKNFESFFGKKVYFLLIQL